MFLWCPGQELVLVVRLAVLRQKVKFKFEMMKGLVSNEASVAVSRLQVQASRSHSLAACSKRPGHTLQYGCPFGLPKAPFPHPWPLTPDPTSISHTTYHRSLSLSLSLSKENETAEHIVASELDCWVRCKVWQMVWIFLWPCVSVCSGQKRSQPKDLCLNPQTPIPDPPPLYNHLCG